MNFSSLSVPLHLSPYLAQAAGLADGAGRAMGIVMLIGFIFGTICVVGGGFAIRRGDTDAGKLSIISEARLLPRIRADTSDRYFFKRTNSSFPNCAARRSLNPCMI